MRTLLSKLEKHKCVCSLAYLDKFPLSFGLNVSDTPFNHYWILDSGTTNHMTPLAQHYSTYFPCPSNQKIVTEDGTLITVAGQGNIQINPLIILKDVLHVPKLSTNLVSITSHPKKFVSGDVTFNEQEGYFNQPYLQGESFQEDKESNYGFPTLPDLIDLTIEPKPNQIEVVPSETSQGRSSHVQESNSTPQKKVIIFSPTMQVEIETQNDLDLLIAIRKGTRKCTKQPLYPLSNYLSFKNFSPAQKTFLVNLNSTLVPNTLSEALFDRKWRQAMDVEMEALEKNNTWELVTLPIGKRPVGRKWIYIVKYVRTMVAKQGTKTVPKYVNQLESLWMEVNHYMVIKAKCSKNSAILREYIEQD
uniref:Retrovirus-related Pol polyprotein from transposon TNT 1-94-like beta-barrel domain-containing protein n=1 Tax=Cajanus cajan TaxID=3821 RepID=A0A151R4C3_CAJCA|nr:hypothetical protein KK1_041410 [Cajanus cajan]